MFLWSAGLCQEVGLVGSCGLRKTLGILSADGLGCVPALLVIWPEASQHWSLQAVEWGQVLVRKWQPPGGLTPMLLLRTTTASVFVPAVSHSHPAPPQETLQYQQLSLPLSPVRSLLFTLGAGVHKTLYAPSKSGISVSLSPVEFLRTKPAALQKQMLWGLLLPLPDLQAGEPDVGLKTFTPVVEPL